jgi:lambda repressor-like predicted transcriptional regulator
MANSRSRTYYTTAQRRAIVEQFRRSGVSQEEFSKRRGVSLSTLQSWLYGRSDRGGKRIKAGLVEVKLPLEVMNRPAATETPAATLRLCFRSGHVLELSSGFRRDEVQALVEILEGAC